MTTLLLALLVAIAAGFAAWRVVARRRSADTQAARETATRTALLAARQGVAEGRTPVAAPPANASTDVEAARASARAKAERVIAAEALRRQAAIQKAQNAARVEAERRAAEAEKAAAALASTLPSTRLPKVERTTPILPKPVVSPAPRIVGEKTAPLVRPVAVAPRAPAVPTVLKTDAQTLVMVVDDSKMVRVKSSRLLTAQGFQVLTAVDGIDALKQLENCCPDLLITDVDMPEMDGFGLVNALRGNARTQHIPLVMITSAEDRHREEALRIGVGLVMGKPYDEAALVAHIRSFKFFAKAEEPEALACA
ncbi:MAG: PleD family two-component system response regulator [Vitreoscilla sp.]